MKGIFNPSVENKERVMITPNYQEVKELAKDYRFIPICKEIYADTVTPI